ncbi:hypothetical protein WJX81_005672 [Elliptochloris bilobata]|uniref:FRIGIDA-like protein n=1 Tax=Elliptochloris bilobata TaxID=381761 RepID=A0AAW1S7I7_9CHLO
MKALRHRQSHLSASLAWEHALDDELQEVLVHTHRAVCATQDKAAKSAVRLLAKRDLLDLCLEGLASHLTTCGQPHEASLLQDLRSFTSQLFEEWRALLEAQETDAREALAARQGEAARAERATAELLDAAQGLHDAHVRLAAANVVLEQDVSRLGRANASLAGDLQRARRRADRLCRAGAAAGKGQQGGAAAAGGPKARELTLGQLHELIEDVYASKARADQRLAAAGQARETMEAHLYGFLTQCYGLRPLILGALAGLLAALARHQQDDADVGLFGRVLRNEVDEEFRAEQAAAARRATAMEVLRALIDPEDQESVLARLCRCSAAKSRPAGAPADSLPDGRSPAAMHFDALLQAVLRHRVECRAAALAPVREAFRLAEGPTVEPMGCPKGDPSGASSARASGRVMRGVLSEAQFATFCALINPAISPREVGVLLAAMTPGGARQVTFSSCAAMLAGELGRMANQH